ncbi:Ig-like domain-containing protein [Glutamicibacter sp.]|uniref:Ig-like domain-containing protein n=1 Tax=Glutamicibacter sp. TaxID=1931995 RepID=UPI0028BE1988|nr:Ig-like domain-containing protein [Glutamicibacter sp.]
MGNSGRTGLSGLLKSTGFKATAIPVVAALAVTGAIFYPGFETADVDLNDGGVWVVNKSEGKIGHVNYQSQTLDGGVVTPMANYDLEQSGENVLVRNLEQENVTTIDPAMVQFAGDNKLPANSTFSFGSNVVAVTDAKNGKVQATKLENISEFDSDGNEPLMEASGKVDAVVGADDTIWAVDYAGNTIQSFTLDDDGYPVAAEPRQVDGLEKMKDPQLSAVGHTAVVFEPSTGTVVTSDGSSNKVESSPNARIQAPGPEAEDVAIATEQTLVKAALKGKDVAYDQVKTAGTPIQPVRVGTCTYAAWQTSGEYLRSCDDLLQNQSVSVPEMAAQAELVFRVNRDVVVLNDVQSGQVWLTNEGMEIVSNWADLEPPAGEGESEEEETKEITDTIELPDRTEENQEPIAKDDSFNVRPGRTTVIPVLFNDVDPDGDLLTAKIEGDGPSLGEISPVYDGTGFQISVPEDAKGSSSFSYITEDGRGGMDTATVNLKVVDEESNKAPEQKRVTTLRVQKGESVSKNLLPDWVDPEGDDLQLLGGTSKGDDTIRVRPDGTLIFQDDGKQLGQKEVTIQVSDGRESTKGRILVEVGSNSTVKPVTATDHVVAQVGEAMSFEPLDNDADPSGDGLRLAGIDDVTGLELKANNQSGRVTVTGERPGTFYTEYLATNGPASAPGLVRVDVRQPAKEDVKPVAVRDIAQLPAGGNVLVDVLGNDTDATGGVLVVTGATDGTDKQFSVSVERNSFVRISDVRGVTSPSTINYTISNGQESSTGEIRVIPIPAPPRMDPPQANPDTVNVREGDVTTVKVLENDVHPNGAAMKLSPKLEETDKLGEGSLISVADDEIRFRAGDFKGKPRQVSAVYTVLGPDGQEASAQVTFNVQPAVKDEADQEKNSPPNPEPVTGRIFAGSTATVQVPLEGIDPEGDSVTLVQLGDAPRQGVANIKGDTIEYTASHQASGTDQFTYVVEDRLGARATGIAKIGIAPLAQSNNPPVAVNDMITVRPQRPVAIDVLNNDTDPDGDPVALMADVESRDGGEVSVVDGRVLLTSPPDQGSTSVRYSISDGRGGTGNGTVTVVSNPNAPLLAPIARDDRVTLEDVLSNDEVSVDVLYNDEDPDGASSELTLTLPDAPDTARVTESGIIVTPTDEPQVIAYTVTDQDGLDSTAFIHVPGLAGARPILRSNLNLQAKAGETLDLDLKDLVLVREGHSPRLSTEDSVSSMPVSDGNLVQSATELRFTAPADFDGMGAVTFEVTDGDGPDDPEGLTSTLTVPINVAPSTNQQPQNQPRNANDDGAPEQRKKKEKKDEEDAAPKKEKKQDEASDKPEEKEESQKPEEEQEPEQPEEEQPEETETPEERPDPENFPPTLESNTLNVAQGGDPARLDLRQAANDQNKEDVAKLKFNLEASQVQGVDAKLVDGYLLELTAPPETPKGTSGTVGVSVSDGVNPAVNAQMYVTVTGSTRELPIAVADNVPQAANNKTEVVDVLANDYNPYADQGPLNIISVRPLDQNSGTAQVRDGKVAITPKEGFVGTMSVEYLIGDVTKDPARNVAGTVTLNVKGAPDAPGLPRIQSTGDSQAVLAWDAPANNGSEITKYMVRSGNGVAQECKTTTCTITSLKNDTTYTFTVTAFNEIGESAASPASAEARPDVEPEQPAAPVGKDGDTKATFNWTAPVSRGSAIQSYTLEISPAPANGVSQVTGITGTSYTWEGLKNGTAYQARVRAVNKASKPSVFSAYSAAVTPAGKPFKPSAPTAIRKDSAVDGGVVNVAWKAPGANGAAISSYVLKVYQGGSEVRSIGGIAANKTSQSVTGLSTSGSYTFRVAAVNRVGASEYSANSVAVTPYGRPKTVGAVTAKATGANRMIQLNFTAPGANGSTITGYQYSMDGGGWNSVGGPGSAIEAGANGTAHSFRVRALNAAGPAEPSAVSNSTSPYGPLRDNANISSSKGDQSVSFTWNKNAGADNGRKITRKVDINGSGTKNDGSQTQNNIGYSASRTLTITATDSEGQKKSWSKTETSKPKPAREVILKRGPYSTKYCGTTNCYQFDVTIKNFEPGRSYEIRCRNQNAGSFSDVYSRKISTDGNGNGHSVPTCENQSGYAMPVWVIVDGTESNRVSW